MLLGCTLLSSASIHAQTDDPGFFARMKAKKAEIKATTDYYVVMGGIANWITVKDTRATNQVYGSPGGGLIFAQVDRRPGVTQYYNYAIGQYGNMLNLGEGSGGHVARIHGGYFQVRELENNSPWITYLGGGLYGLYHGKFLPSLNNSLYHHEATASLRARFELEREFRLRRKNVVFQYRIQLPLVTYINRRPEYGLVIGGSSNYVKPVGEWNQIVSEIGLEGWVSDRNDNRWRISYEWDYSRFSENTHVTQIAAHSLIFTYLLHK